MFGGNNTFSHEQKSSRTTQQQNELFGRREGLTINIRREGRQNEIHKRRQQNAMAPLKIIEDVVEMSPFEAKIKQFKKSICSVNQISQFVNCINSSDLEKIFYAVIGIRKLLSVNQEPPIQLIIDAGLVPRIVELAKQNQNEGVKAEAVWCLCNIASGTTLQTQEMVDCSGIEFFVDLLNSTNDFVLEQSLWAIGNLSADSVSYRDRFITHGILPLLYKIIAESQNIAIISQGCWVIANIIRTHPIPNFEILKPAIKSLAEVMIKGRVTDQSVMTDILWSFAYVIEQDKVKLTFLVQTGIVPKLVQILYCGIDQITAAAIRTIGNICYGDEDHIELLLSNGLLKAFEKLIVKDVKDIKKQICWALSNIAASNARHVKQLFDNKNLINSVFEILIALKPLAAALEAGYVFVNACQFGDPNMVIVFYHHNRLIEIFVKTLSHSYTDIVQMGLKGISICLKLGKQINQTTGVPSLMMSDIQSCNGIDALQNAQMHQSARIYKIAKGILNSYFDLASPLD